MMAGGTLRAVLLGATLSFLFASTTLLTTVYHNTQLRRGEQLYRAGIELARQGKTAMAAEKFRAALAFKPSDSRYRVALARTLLELDDWREAESHLAELREDDPTSSTLNLMLARLARREGSLDEAISLYRRAIYGEWTDESQRRSDVHFELIDLLFRSGRQQQAIAELIQLASEPGADVAARMRAARMLLAKGVPDRAAHAFAELAEQHPRDGEIYAALGDAKFATGDFAAARDAYRKALRWSAHDPALLNRAATINTILALDPTEMHLTAAERFRRARLLLERELESIEACAGGAGKLTGNTAVLVDAVQPLLKERRERPGDTLRALSLARQLWTEEQRICGPGHQRDEVAGAIVAKLAK